MRTVYPSEEMGETCGHVDLNADSLTGFIDTNFSGGGVYSYAILVIVAGKSFTTVSVFMRYLATSPRYFQHGTESKTAR